MTSLPHLAMASNLATAVRRITVHPLVRSAAAYGGAAALHKGLGFVLFIWLAHELPVTEYATFGLLYALQTALSTFAIAGIVETAMGRLKDHRTGAERRQLFGATNTSAALVASASAVLVLVIHAFVVQDPVPESIGTVALVIVAGVLTAFFSLQAALVRLEERHLASLSLSFVPALAALIGGACGFVVGGSVGSFYVGTAAALVLVMVPFAQRAVGCFSFERRREQLYPVLRRLPPYLLIAVLAWAGGYGNTYLAKAFYASTEVAHFTFAYTISSVLQLVATSLNQVWNPRFLQRVHVQPLEQVERGCRTFSTLQGLALGVVGGALLVIVPALTRFVGGNLQAYGDLNLELLLLFLAYALSIPWWHSQNYFYAYDKGRDLMSAMTFGSLLGLLLALLAVWVLGPIGLYLGFALQMLARTLGALIWARRNWRIAIAWEGTTLAAGLLGVGAALSAAIS